MFILGFKFAHRLKCCAKYINKQRQKIYLSSSKLLRVIYGWIKKEGAMKNIYLKLTLIALVASLAGCSDMGGMMPGTSTTPQMPSEVPNPAKQGVIATSVDKAGKETGVNLTMAGGGEIGLKSMDANDKSKMSRALDSGTGKATHWVNSSTGMNYTVTPIKKVVIENNPFCRQYLVVVARGANQKEISGTACVTTDGSWHTI